MLIIWQRLCAFGSRIKQRLTLQHQQQPAAVAEQHYLPLLQTMQDFSTTIIREIMIPRTDMIAASIQSQKYDLEHLVRNLGHSRIPIYHDNIDHIIGILHVKDLVALPSEQSFVLKNLLRATFYVPEVMKISELLREFQRRKTHLAIVVDEYGGTAGVVTLEDIIEELVGEIQDEYDVDEHDYRIINDKILAKGQLSLWALEENFGICLPREGEYETLAGFLTHQLGCLPVPGSVVHVGKVRFTVKEAGEKRVESVEITQKN